MPKPHLALTGYAIGHMTKAISELASSLAEYESDYHAVYAARLLNALDDIRKAETLLVEATIRLRDLQQAEST